MEICNDGESCSKYSDRGMYSSYYKLNPNKPLNTITAGSFKSKCGGFRKHDDGVFYAISRGEAILSQTFPTDYDFKGLDPYYLLGMSVPPVMVAQIATKIREQWASIF